MKQYHSLRKCSIVALGLLSLFLQACSTVEVTTRDNGGQVSLPIDTWHNTSIITQSEDQDPQVNGHLPKYTLFATTINVTIPGPTALDPKAPSKLKHKTVYGAAFVSTISDHIQVVSIKDTYWDNLVGVFTLGLKKPHEILYDDTTTSTDERTIPLNQVTLKESFFDNLLSVLTLGIVNHHVVTYQHTHPPIPEDAKKILHK
jgi:hypothetical protein